MRIATCTWLATCLSRNILTQHSSPLFRTPDVLGIWRFPCVTEMCVHLPWEGGLTHHATRRVPRSSDLDRVAQVADLLGHLRGKGEEGVLGREGRHVLAAVLSQAVAVEAGHDE